MTQAGKIPQPLAMLQERHRSGIDTGLRNAFYAHPAVQAKLAALEPEVLAGRMSPFAAAEAILNLFRFGV